MNLMAVALAVAGAYFREPTPGAANVTRPYAPRMTGRRGLSFAGTEKSACRRVRVQRTANGVRRRACA